jgi:undecaprenyl phosphate-alpha-L-ara4N flippase subunit ArnE
MIPPGYAALALAVMLLTLAQVLQKLAVAGLAQGVAMRELLVTVLRRPAMWAAVACLGSGMIAWLLVLDTMDVSKAFPYLSIGQVLVLLVARYYFHERISPVRWAGALMIFAGISLVAQS